VKHLFFFLKEEEEEEEEAFLRNKGKENQCAENDGLINGRWRRGRKLDKFAKERATSSAAEQYGRRRKRRRRRRRRRKKRTMEMRPDQEMEVEEEEERGSP